MLGLTDPRKSDRSSEKRIVEEMLTTTEQRVASLETSIARKASRSA